MRGCATDNCFGTPQNEARISGSALGLMKEQSIRGGYITRSALVNFI